MAVEPRENLGDRKDGALAGKPHEPWKMGGMVPWRVRLVNTWVMGGC